jgi:redox-sensitive bicupin YhaK (pirin superfamily)
MQKNENSEMKGLKSVINRVPSQAQAEGVGATVRRSIGSGSLRNLDPFIMLDEFIVKKPSGFPDHPHRGFETVTYMLKGSFQHEDFKGHRGTINPGDLQWMTAGRGILHAEMPLTDEATGLQLWINLPAKDKMIPPNYQELKSEEVPIANNPDGTVRVKVIAGESYGISAKVHTNSPIYYLDVSMTPNSKFEQVVPEGWTSFIYTLSGHPIVGSETVASDPHCTLVLDTFGSNLIVKTLDNEARFVLIAGKPIGEPIAQHGPFVMNTQDEIHQAIVDYQNNQNGFEGAREWESKIALGL